MPVKDLDKMIRQARMKLWGDVGGDEPPTRSATIIAAMEALLREPAKKSLAVNGVAPPSHRASRRPNRIKRGAFTEGEALSIRKQYETMRPGGRLQRIAKQLRCSDTTIRRIIEGTYTTIKGKNLPSMIGKDT